MIIMMMIVWCYEWAAQAEVTERRYHLQCDIEIMWILYFRMN